MADLNVPGPDGNIDLTGKKGSKMPLVIVGIVVVGVIGFVAFRAIKTRDERKKHAEFIEAFQAVEKEEVAKFWLCVLGQGADAGMFPDNLALGARITSQFGVDPKGYPTKVREECTIKAKDAKNAVEKLTAPSAYEESLKKYANALKDEGDALDAWGKVAPAQIEDMQIAKKMPQALAAYQAFEGKKPPDDVVNYDEFLRCAVPTVDTLKDGQAMLEILAKECKKPEFTGKLVDVCGKKLIADPAPAAHKLLIATQKKMGAEARQEQAFDDCMRRGRKGKRRDDLADVGKAWLSWQTAGADIRKIGKEALKD
jgi:hypothetical protein